MPGPDHTKSIAEYRLIMREFEPRYRAATPAARVEVMNEIADEIRSDAKRTRARLPSAEDFPNKIIHYYTNHRTTPLDDGSPPVAAGKKWTARLVADHIYHSEIEEEVAKLGPLDPHERIAQWAIATSEIIAGLDEGKMAEFLVLAQRWNDAGPPRYLQRSEAKLKTGKYVMSFLDHIKKNLGVHAVVFVGYQDPEGVKVSDFESDGLQDVYEFGALNAKAVKGFRDIWGPWVKKTLGEPSDGALQGGEDGEDEAGPSAAIVLPADRFLQLTDNGLYKLGPCPTVGLKAEIAKALHTYVGQQWRLKGGGKQVPWGKLMANNGWYIDGAFLLKNRVLFNPTRLSDAAVKEFWDHWYDLAQKGEGFSFKTVAPYKAKVVVPGGDSDDDKVEEPELPKNDGEVVKGKGAEVSGDESSGIQQQEGAGKAPKHCKSDKERIAFLRSLLPQSEHVFHSVVSAVSSMESSPDAEIVAPAGCFFWRWRHSSSDVKLHTEGSAELEALCAWLNQKPHLTASGSPVDRTSLLQHCLGLGLLLRDAQLIQYTEEGEHLEGTAPHIIQSCWGMDELEIFSSCIKQVRTDLVSKHKRKASVEDPAPAKQKARKAAAKPQSLEDGDEGSSVSQVPAKRKPKVNARSKSKKVIADTPETEDEEAGPSNTIKTRRSVRTRSQPSKLQDTEQGGSRKKVGSNKRGGAKK